MEDLNTPLYVPECPTLFPSMLLAGGLPGHYPPFDADRVHWFYFARNAVWNAVKLFDLVGAEVLVPSYHHGVEIEALVHAGARPVFYRVGGHWDVDLEDVAARIGPRTRALYLTHYAGFPGPVQAMRQLADRHGIALIEDCALSLLSSDGEHRLGTGGDASVFCLYKTLPVPNGGALQINSGRHLLNGGEFELPALPAPPAASVFSHAASALLKNVEMRGGRLGRWARSTVRGLAGGAVRAGRVERVATGTMHFNPDHLCLGISPLTLRIAHAQDLDDCVARRRRNYLELLARLAPLSTPLFRQLPVGVCPLFYPVLSDDKPAVLARLWAAGIEAVDFWRDHHPACDPAEFPDTMDLRRRVVEIPCHQDLDSETLNRMAEVVCSVLREVERPRRRPAAATRH
jgi:perosamine synthetase